MQPRLNLIRHHEPSYSCSQDTQAGPNDYLLDLVTLAAKAALNSQVTVPPHARHFPDSQFYNVWPGEHYRLLSGLCWAMGGRVHAVEVGTLTGMGTTALLEGTNQPVITYDIVPYQKFSSHLLPAQFEQGRCIQILADLQNPDIFPSHALTMNNADLIFMDGPKDGRFEYRFTHLLCEHLKPHLPNRKRIMVVDDIRFVNMIEWWRSVQSPKLDITGFGHFTGTGLIDITDGLKWGEWA